MRVIAGKARHIQLKTIETMDTRPTTDRIKETLFNMLGNNVYETRFLDLFSGSGGIGIEALSRGATQAVFVENNNKAAMCIKENLQKTKLEENAKVMVSDVFAAIDTLSNKASKEPHSNTTPISSPIAIHLSLSSSCSILII